MPIGSLSCSHTRTRRTLYAIFESRKVGSICEDCALDLYALRAFIIAARWLYHGKQLRFVPAGPGLVEPLQARLLSVVAFEVARAEEARRLAVEQMLARSVQL